MSDLTEILVEGAGLGFGVLAALTLLWLLWLASPLACVALVVFCGGGAAINYWINR